MKKSFQEDVAVVVAVEETKSSLVTSNSHGLHIPLQVDFRLFVVFVGDIVEHHTVSRTLFVFARVILQKDLANREDWRCSIVACLQAL